MAKFPIHISIQCIFPENKKEFLTCTSLLRIIPGNREVYEASWNDRAVIAKVFSHKIKARHHLRREWRGLNLLQERGFNSIRPLFCGRTDDGRWAVVVEKILESLTARNVLDEVSEKSERLKLLQLICVEIAKQHEQGVFQKDIHLGNFLLSGEKVFALDTGTMKFFSHPVSRTKAISQLAMLACYLPDEDKPSIDRLLDTYLMARKWQIEGSDEQILQKQRTLQRQKATRKSLEKRLRTSKRFLRIQTGRYLAVFDRGFYSGADPIDFMKRIDTLMDAGNVIKNGNTCTVSHILWNNREVVVKRYNNMGLIHSVRHTMKGSRARRGWLCGHRLVMLNIATPRPLAYIEQRRWPLICRSYIVTEYIGAQSLRDLLRDSGVHEDHRTKAIEQVMDLLNRLAKYRISHGDMKHSNILITSRGPVLTDLDSMKISRWNWLYKRRRDKDMRRFSEPQNQ